MAEGGGGGGATTRTRGCLRVWTKNGRGKIEFLTCRWRDRKEGRRHEAWIACTSSAVHSPFLRIPCVRGAHPWWFLKQALSVRGTSMGRFEDSRPFVQVPRERSSNHRRTTSCVAWWNELARASNALYGEAMHATSCRFPRSSEGRWEGGGDNTRPLCSSMHPFHFIPFHVLEDGLVSSTRPPLVHGCPSLSLPACIDASCGPSIGGCVSSSPPSFHGRLLFTLPRRRAKSGGLGNEA